MRPDERCVAAAWPQERDRLEDQLLFLVGSPRSGSTLLARMLGAHSAIHAPAEPHLLTPLAHLGYYGRAERAPYDPVISERAARELVAALPHGESDYLESLRACTDSLYGKLLAPTSRKLLLDKTPAYSLVLDFVARLYPRARYIVLTRHPMAIWSSYVDSFFDGDPVAAHANNALLERYVPAIARFLREQPAPICHVRYEELVSDPETQVRRICDFAGIAFEPAMVDYGSQQAGRVATARGLGDPHTVARETRPTTASLARWAKDLTGKPERLQQSKDILASLLDPDLEIWGYDRKQIERELDAVDPDAAPARGRALSRYRLERAALVMARRNIHRNLMGRGVRKVREVCDLLLR